MTDMVDVMLYVMPSQAFLERWHLAAKEHPIFQLWQPGELWHIKGKPGYPWDGNVYDDNYIYQVYTEGPDGWTDPSSYKRFVSKSWPNGQGGICWCPRYIKNIRESPHPVFLLTPDSTYETWKNNQLVNTQQLGLVQCQISGPYNLECGQLGVQECLVQTYQWDPNFLHMEVNWYALGLGWVKWQLWKIEGGHYVLVQETNFFQLEEGGTPPLVFEGN